MKKPINGLLLLPIITYVIPENINILRFSIKLIKDKHNARNPKTGEIIYVPVKKKVSFKMSKHLKEEINKK